MGTDTSSSNYGFGQCRAKTTGMGGRRGTCTEAAIAEDGFCMYHGKVATGYDVLMATAPGRVAR